MSSPFKGRIFISGAHCVHEIYNSAKLDSLYIDIDDKISSKRKTTDLLLGEEVLLHSVVSDNTDLPDAKKRYSAVSENTDLVLGEVLQVVSDNTDFLLTEKKKKQAPSLGDSLPVTGPTDSGMLIMDIFHVLVHKDSGNPEIEDGYIDKAEYSFFGIGWSLPREDTFEPFRIDYHPFNQPYHLEVDCDFGLLTLECTVFPSSKSVHLEVEWLKPNKNAATDEDDDIYICGSLTVTPSIKIDGDNIPSVLLKTPPNKAVKVSSDGSGDFIPLLKSVAVVPFSSSFTVNAQLLQYSDNANSAFSPIVENGAATFPVEDDDKDASDSPEFSDRITRLKRLVYPFYKSTKYIPCIGGGVLKLTAHVT